MRLSLALAAAFVLAAPAAAQPDAAQILLGALQQAHQDVPESVQDYMLTLASGPVRAQVYVHRAGDQWQVVVQDDAPLADLFKGMVLWPRLAMLYRPGLTPAGASAAVGGVRYLGTETVEGREAHVLETRVPGLTLETMEMPDSAARVLVDAQTRRLLRVATSVDVEPTYGGAMENGGHVDMEVTFGGYESIHGITLPRRWRMHVRMQSNLTAEQRQAMLDEMQPVLDALAGDNSDRAAQMRLLLELFIRTLNGEPMDIPAVLQDVRVNPGLPEWAEDW